MRRVGTKAHLYLNGKNAGVVTIRGWDNAWGFGQFEPQESFSEFAPLFGSWALLMHADDDEQRISEAASEELRHLEYAIDHIHARLFLIDQKQWRDISQLNIDGGMIEWKEK